MLPFSCNMAQHANRDPFAPELPACRKLISPRPSGRITTTPCFSTVSDPPYQTRASRRGRRPPVPVIRSPPHPARAGAESARRAAQTEPHGSRGRGTGKAAQNHGSSAACLLARRGGSSDDVAGARPCVSEGFTAPGELKFFFHLATPMGAALG